MHTRQGVAVPALSQDSARPNPSSYEQDAARRAALHQQNWDAEPLTPWQELLLDRLAHRNQPDRAVQS